MDPTNPLPVNGTFKSIVKFSNIKRELIEGFIKILIEQLDHFSLEFQIPQVPLEAVRSSIVLVASRMLFGNEDNIIHPFDNQMEVDKYQGESTPHNQYAISIVFLRNLHVLQMQICFKIIY